MAVAPVPALTRSVTASIVAVLGLVTLPAQAATPRADVVTMANGDRMTGEIEKLNQGLLQLKTDHAGTLELEWPSVESIESRNPFEVVLVDGRRLYGSLRPAPGRELDVVATSAERVGLESVVEILPLERSFWQQISGSTSLGFSLSQANDTTTWTAAVDAEYLTRRYAVAASASSYLNAQTGVDTTTRNLVGLSLGRLLPSRFSLVELNELFQSDQLGIRLRATFGLGVVHDVIHTNRNELSPAVGIAYSNTTFDDGTAGRREVLARLGLRYSLFTFSHHKTSLGASLSFLPSLSDWGHVRLDVNARFRVKLFADFYWSVEAYENYDNEPPPGGAANDSGGSASLAWSF
jgi:hypothetical protein